MWDSLCNCMLYEVPHYLFPHDTSDDYDEQLSRIMQSTGLADREGKEIFEGDIVKVISKSDFKMWSDSDSPHIVKWDGCCFSFRNKVGDASLYHFCKNDEYDVEIIGNIYENTELLK